MKNTVKITKHKPSLTQSGKERRQQHNCSDCGVYIGLDRVRKLAVCLPCYNQRDKANRIVAAISLLERNGYIVINGSKTVK